MDAVDASAHYEVSTAEETPALLTIILDTNPRAWALLSNTLPLSKAIANILVFANSHLALSSTNQVAFIASHVNRAVWLYPTPNHAEQNKKATTATDGDIAMADADNNSSSSSSANKFPQFRQVETTLLQSVRALVTSTNEPDLDESTTLLSGALTLALAHINKTGLLLPTAAASSSNNKDGSSSGGGRRPGDTSASGRNPQAAVDSSKGLPSSSSTSGNPDDPSSGASAEDQSLHARILVVSVSDSSPAQYIPTMNAVFAAAHAGVAIDVLALHGAATFLQQAAYITRGTFLAVPDHTQGLLTYLMLGFSAASARDVAACLVPPSADAVDFRAACFCHRRVVDTGFVCSICLSIFCEIPPPPPDAPPGTATECLTCGSRLRLGRYGAKPAVVPRPKKKKKRRLGGVREGTTSTVGTPMAT